jgi:hypothetical protein
MPYARSFSRASSPIQSVVHAGVPAGRERRDDVALDLAHRGTA